MVFFGCFIFEMRMKNLCNYELVFWELKYRIWNEMYMKCLVNENIGFVIDVKVVMKLEDSEILILWGLIG